MWFGIMLLNFILTFTFLNDKLKKESKGILLGVCFGAIILVLVFGWLFG